MIITHQGNTTTVTASTADALKCSNLNSSSTAVPKLNKLIKSPKNTVVARSNGFKLHSITSIQSSIKKLAVQKRDLTVSALFYSLVVQDISFLKNCTRTDASDFDVVLRVLLPVQWNAAENKYKYNSKKSLASADKLDLDIVTMQREYKNSKLDKTNRDKIVNEFYDACVEYYNSKSEGVKNNSLDADELAEKNVERIQKRLQKVANDAIMNGVTLESILDTLIQAGYSGLSDKLRINS